MINVSFVIPAYNEADRIGSTLKSLKHFSSNAEIIVVNDGSTDQTKRIAEKYANKVITLPINHGKGFALQIGWREAKGTYIACLDADLEESANEVTSLLSPLEKQQADVAISIVKAGKHAGLGFVKKRVQALIYQQTGVKLEAPLSGQRAFHRKWLSVLLARAYQGFGVEAQMTIDLLKAGAKCVEIPTTMTHREMGRNMKGFVHRLKQWVDIERQCRGTLL
ncbi:glycosyltransferase family 2 protein [Halalkalibacter nanhaiisediminis]|uniref:Glucosyl-3-phosphoglycerate synthase n=1 Tax=Halalkalibacter nanhaiisediminis TaxID=688079 RepID=A0A562QIR2_9BACI|nr:glycosyltransferase family 2 protein [Halalkalibacter nanhaiisediminis]TWI55936.1 glycosyl transferase family 2 [Halalkalibacter nanhaiisediminis]